MAFASTLSTKEPRAFSVGPLKVEIRTFTAANGDTSGTVTAERLSEVVHCQIDSLQLTAAPTCSGNTAVLAFADPGASAAAGTIILFGR